MTSVVRESLEGPLPSHLATSADAMVELVGAIDKWANLGLIAATAGMCPGKGVYVDVGNMS